MSTTSGSVVVVEGVVSTPAASCQANVPPTTAPESEADAASPTIQVVSLTCPAGR